MAIKILGAREECLFLRAIFDVLNTNAMEADTEKLPELQKTFRVPYDPELEMYSENNRRFTSPERNICCNLVKVSHISR